MRRRTVARLLGVVWFSMPSHFPALKHSWGGKCGGLKGGEGGRGGGTRLLFSSMFGPWNAYLGRVQCVQSCFCRTQSKSVHGFGVA